MLQLLQYSKVHNDCIIYSSVGPHKQVGAVEHVKVQPPSPNRPTIYHPPPNTAADY